MSLKTNDYEHTFQIRINKIGNGKDTKITGILSYNSLHYDNKNTKKLYVPIEKRTDIDFNPLTILGELDSLNRIFPFTVTNNKKHSEFLSNLNPTNLQKYSISLDNLEELRINYELDLKCQILIDQKNIISEKLQKRMAYVESRTFVPLIYEFGKDNKAILKKEYLKSDHQFYYQCFTMPEILFAILHFMVIHEYEFSTCALCGRSYVKIPCQGQGKYCSRQNPFSSHPYLVSKKVTYKEHFDNLDCKQAMRKYNQILRNLKKSRLLYGPSEPDDTLKFYKEIQNHRKKICTFDDYVALFNFVRDYNFK